MDGYKKIISSQKIRFTILRTLRVIPDKWMLKLQYRVKFKRKLDLKNPKKFTEKIIIPEFSNDDLVNFANAYANEQGYVIDEMAVLAIHNRISEIERLDEMTSLDEMKDIIDDAIECEAHSGLRKFIGIFTAARYTDDEKIVLREKDFE